MVVRDSFRERTAISHIFLRVTYNLSARLRDSGHKSRHVHVHDIDKHYTRGCEKQLLASFSLTMSQWWLRSKTEKKL